MAIAQYAVPRRLPHVTTRARVDHHAPPSRSMKRPAAMEAAPTPLCHSPPTTEVHFGYIIVVLLQRRCGTSEAPGKAPPDADFFARLPVGSNSNKTGRGSVSFI